MNPDDWRLDRLGPEQLILLGLVLAILFLVISLILISRRKSRASRELGIPLQEFRKENPCFYQVMTAVAKAGKSAELTQKGDVRAALRLLQSRTGKRPARSKKPDRSSLLHPAVPVPRREDAATLTIVRAVYMDDSLRDSLPPAVVDAIDRHLDSLTG